MGYVFDTNTLIEAKNRYYSFSVCPAFWDWLLLERRRANVLSIAAIRDELKDADAKQWAAANPGFFDANDDSRMGEVSNWVYAQTRFTPAARSEFLRKADARLISYALARGYTLVTQEVSAPKSMKTVKIPDVCKALRVPWINTFDVLEALSARFILDTSAR